MRIRVGVLLVVAVAVTVARAQHPSDICTLQYGEGVVLHKSYKTGDQWCCKEITCPPGYQPVVCREDDPYTTNCERCPDNTFQSEDLSSSDLKQCNKKQECPEGMIREDDGSAVRDSRCVCDLNKGLCNSSKSRMMFCQTGSCPIGKELNNDCSCSDCLAGYYKAEEGSARCKPWTNCKAEGKVTGSEGSSATDRVCKDKEKASTVDNNDIQKGENASNITNNPPPGVSTMDQTIFIVIIVVATILTLALGVIIFVFIRRRNLNDNNKSHQDAEQPNGNVGGTDEHRPDDNRVINNRHEGEARQEEQQTLLPCEAPREGQTPSPAPDAARNPLLDEESVEIWREKLRHCRVKLQSSLEVGEVLLSVLLTNESITPCMKENIQAMPTRSKMADELLDVLAKRPVFAFHTFICALIHTRQEELAFMLDKKLTETYDELLHESDIDISELVQSFVS